MRNILLSMTCIVCLCIGISCADDEKVILNPDDFTASVWLETFDDVLILDKNEAEEMLDTLRWTAADFGYQTIINYEIQVAVKSEEAEEPAYVTIGISNQNTYALKVKELNEALLAAGAVKRRATDFRMRVKASISNRYQELVSQDVVFNATTFSNDPDLLYIVGDYTGFSIEGAEVLYSPNWNGEYEGYVYLPSLEQGIKLIEEIAPETEWGLPASFVPATTIQIEPGGAVIAPGSFVPGSNMEEVLDGSGFYKMVVKITENAKTFILYKFYKEFFVCGQRNMNYKEWANSMSNQNPENETGTGAVLTYNPDEKVWEAKNVYIPQYQTDAAGVQNTNLFEFKFRANAVRNIWANAANLGGADNVWEDGMQKGRISGTGNIKLLAPEGTYDFKVYLQSYPYRYELIPSGK